MARHPRTVPIAFVVAALVAGAAAADCKPIPGSGELLRAGTTVLLGELHGTAESPPVVADLACLALEAGLGVTVGLELPQADQTQVDVFLASRSAALARARLLTGDFWQRDYQDGRTSEAMLELHVRLRELAAPQGKLRIAYLDDTEHPANRDQAMAERVLAARTAAPQDVVIVLTGNLHNRLVRGTPFDPGREPMGLLVARRASDAAVVSLELTHGAGSAWICQGSRADDCMAVGVGGKDPDGDGIVLLPDAVGQPVNGHLHVGAITASPPARTVE
jgi:hypothetical protein